MKIKAGRYNCQSHWGFGIYFTSFNEQYNSIVIDIIVFYVELVIRDYKDAKEEKDGDDKTT